MLQENQVIGDKFNYWMNNFWEILKLFSCANFLPSHTHTRINWNSTQLRSPFLLIVGLFLCLYTSQYRGVLWLGWECRSLEKMWILWPQDSWANLIQVSVGLPLFLFPVGVHLIASLWMETWCILLYIVIL